MWKISKYHKLIILFNSILFGLIVYYYFLSHSLLELRPPSELHIDTGCGNWQQSYALLHSEILRRPPSEQRILVQNSVTNGFGDRINQIPGAFLLSILTNRAFKLRWANAIHLSEVFDKSQIDWDWPTEKAPDKDSAIHYDNFGVWPIPYDRGDRQTVLFSTRNLTEYFSEFPILSYEGNVGQVMSLFLNPHHKDTLAKMGLKPETACRCVFDFLFKPGQNLIKKILEISKWTIPGEPPPLTIGIQARFGDRALNEGGCDVTSSLAKWILQCVEQVSQEFKKFHNQTVMYYLVTDCFNYRQTVQEKFKNVITVPDSWGKPVHLVGSQDKEQFLKIVAEWWVFGGTDYKVVCSGSTFGITSALRDHHENSVFMVSEKNPPSCGRNNILSFDQYGSGRAMEP